MTDIITTSTTIIETVEVVSLKAPLTLRIKAAPSIRQIYWCTFPEDYIIPEMGKQGGLPRPVVILSFKNTLHGPVTILPISTDPQEGKSAEWAHKLSLKVDGKRDSWVVCNHPYTFSTKRLGPAKVIPRLTVAEFDEILVKVLNWLPKPNA